MPTIIHNYQVCTRTLYTGYMLEELTSRRDARGAETLALTDLIEESREFG